MTITIYNLKTFLPTSDRPETIHEAEDLISHDSDLFYYPSEVNPNDCPNYIASLND